MLSWCGEEEETGCSCSDDDCKDGDGGEDDDGYDNDEDILIEGWMWYRHITAVIAEALLLHRSRSLSAYISLIIIIIFDGKLIINT